MEKLTEIYRKHKRLCILLFWIVLIAFPFVMKSLPTRVMTTIFLYCILSMGNMLISGHTGMLNMGHAAFYGTGAYISAVLATRFGLPFPLCMLCAIIGTAACGFLVSIPCLRLSTDFLSLITTAFSYIFLTIVRNWMSVTNGPMGITSIPAASIFGFQIDSAPKQYFLVLIMTVICYLLLNNVINSKTGRAMQSIRDNEIGALSVGIHTSAYKILAFVIGTAFAGLAGSLMSQYIGFVGPNNFVYDVSLTIMQMCILGGLGNLRGALVGAAFLTVIPEIIRPLAVYRVGLGGLIMIMFMLFRPQGIIGSRAFAVESGLQNQIKAWWLRRKLLKQSTDGPSA